MSPLQRQPQQELINVHRVTGDKDVIIFLKNAEHEFVEGLFYQAKRYGISEFYFRDVKFEIRRNKDSSFTVIASEDQNVSTEQFA